MMSLYPTLEDLKVSQLEQAQYVSAGYPMVSAPAHPSVPAPAYSAGNQGREFYYPSLDDFMGLSISSAPLTPANQQRNHLCTFPVSGSNISGIKRSIIRPGVSELILCKDEKNLVGFKVRDISKGVFVQFVKKNSPAALAGLRFGDQILTINDEVVAGYSADKVHKLVKKSNPNNIRVAVKDRPMERIITVTKDSANTVGFSFKNGVINGIVKDSSAARNGVLTDHQLVEVDGQNVIGLKDKKLIEMFQDGGNVITITLMPVQIYEHMIKKLGSDIKQMDHAVPDC